MLDPEGDVASALMRNKTANLEKLEAEYAALTTKKEELDALAEQAGTRWTRIFMGSAVAQVRTLDKGFVVGTNPVADFHLWSADFLGPQLGRDGTSVIHFGVFVHWSGLDILHSQQAGHCRVRNHCGALCCQQK